jgi:hypothetical protein
MSFLIAESNVKIYEYNRIIRDLNGFTKEDFLTRFECAYVKAAADEIKPHLNVRLVG